MELKVQYVQAADLHAADYNPRVIAPGALAKLAALMDRHGFVVPVVARRSDMLVIGGHQRLAANARRKQPDGKVPVIFLDDLDDAHAKALNIALNNTQAQGKFDPDMLAGLLADISSDLVHDGLHDIDLESLTAFDIGELEDMLAGLTDEPIAPLAENCGRLPAEPTDPTGLGELDITGGSEGKPAGCSPLQADVTVVFETSRQQYEEARKHFDHLITTHGLKCRIRMDNEA